MENRKRFRTRVDKKNKKSSHLSNKNRHPKRSSSSDPDNIKMLFSVIGNHDIKHLLDLGQIQAKLNISQPADYSEREADRIADQVVNMASGTPINSKSIKNKIQLKGNSDKNSLPSSSGNKINGLSGGKPLSSSVRNYFEPRFGTDLGHVRVHNDTNANKLSKSINARAFTYGNNIAFADNEYQPGTKSGDKLIAHELTHVLQQSNYRNNMISRSIVESQTQNSSPSSAGMFQNSIGLVAVEGLKLRSSMDTSTPEIKKLGFNTKIFIQNEYTNGWYYAHTEDGDEGYVASNYIKTGLPEPNAKLHRIEEGESAIGIAEKYYKNDALNWGQDLRYYVNVLVHANEGEGSRGIYKVNQDDSWEDTRTRNGYYIWIPSVEYAKAIQGSVDSGSLTYGIYGTINEISERVNLLFKDFEYANSKVGELIPGKLADGALDAIKSAVIMFAVGLVLTGLVLALTSAIGAAIGAVIGFFAGGVGAAPGAVLGAEIGFEVGMFLLKWIGLGFLAIHGTVEIAKLGKAFGLYIAAVFEARGDRNKLDQAAELCAEAVSSFVLTVLELIVILAMAWGMGKAMSAVAESKFGKNIGMDKLMEWVAARNRSESTKSLIPNNVNHATATNPDGGVTAAEKAQSILNGINPKYLNPESRFGAGFYVAGNGETSIVELAAHEAKAEIMIRFQLSLRGQKVLDLTNPKIASKWGFRALVSTTEECQAIGAKAVSEGYSVVIFQSYRGNAYNYVIFDNFEEVLIPQMVSPVP